MEGSEWEYEQRTQPPGKLGGITRFGNFRVVTSFLQIAPSKRQLASLKMLKLSSISWYESRATRATTGRRSKTSAKVEIKYIITKL